MISKTKYLWTTLLALCLLSGAAKTKNDPFYFFRNGKMESVLVVGKDAPPAVKKSVKRFSDLVTMVTGKTMPCSAKAVPGKNNIILHWEERYPHDVDRFSIRFPKKDLMRITASVESMDYALNHILKEAFHVQRLVSRTVGYEWRRKRHPLAGQLPYSFEKVIRGSLPRKDITRTASFNFKRQICTHYSSDWNTRNSFPGIHDMILWAFPYTKYVVNDSWPKEILPVLGGKRFVMPKGTLKDGKGRFQSAWQPCWSNPATLRIAVENILEQLEIAKKQGKKVYSINLDVNDRGGCCQCSKCTAALQKDRRNRRPVRYSNLYWKWINGIAEAVTKKYPHLYFNCIAYREVIDPPEFKLHPNVIPQVCRELSACSEPRVRKVVEGFFQRWSKKANVIFLWDYQYGAASAYLFPRVYFHKQAEYFRMAYKNRVRGMFIETTDPAGFEGPKQYLNNRIMWDINTDVDKTLREWYVAFAGKKAAPYLEQYFTFWERYWTRPEIKQTNWYTSVTSTYMQLNEQGTYTYILRKGEMAKLRRLLEKAFANAETPVQKRRLENYLNDCFFSIETAAKCLFSEYLRPDGTLASAKDAVELLKSVPEAAKAFREVTRRGLLNRVLRGNMEAGLVSNINAILPFRKDPAVQAEIRKLAADKTLPKALYAQMQIMLGKQYKNIFENGSFETPVILPKGVKLDSTHVSHGKKAICFKNGYYQFFTGGIKPGKTYYIAVDVYSPTASIEGKFSVLLAPRAKNRNMDWKKLTNIKLTKGWQTIAFAYQTRLQHKKIDNLRLDFHAVHFERNEVLWADNIRVYQLD